MHNNQTPRRDLAAVLSSHKDRFLKAAQYLLLFASWYHQSRGRPAAEQEYLQLYKEVFYLRRLHRLGHFLSFVRPLLDAYAAARQKASENRVCALLAELCRVLFYLLDNVSIVLKFSDSPRPWYLRVRRASFTCFLVSLLLSLVLHARQLRRNFAREHLDSAAPRSGSSQFVQHLREVDEERGYLALTIFSNVGDLFPALERMSITEELIYTRINRGTVAFFGFGSALMDLIRASRFGA